MNIMSIKSKMTLNKRIFLTGLIIMLSSLIFISDVKATSTWTSGEYPGAVQDIDSKMYYENRVKANDGSSAYTIAYTTYGYLNLYNFVFDIGNVYIYSVMFEVECKCAGLFSWGSYYAIVEDGDDFYEESSSTSHFSSDYDVYFKTIAVNDNYNPDNQLTYKIWFAKSSLGTIYVDYIKIWIQYDLTA